MTSQEISTGDHIPKHLINDVRYSINSEYLTSFIALIFIKTK